MEHFKSDILFAQPSINIDRENGILKNVMIIHEGVCKNGDYVSPEFLNDLVELGNAQKQGVKSRFGHPQMCKSTIGTFIGRFKNYQVINEHSKYKVIADLHLDAITKKSSVEGQDIKMFDYLMDMAETNPDMFGTSIHFTASGEPYDHEDGNQYNKPTIQSYIASDIVDSPAATDSFFKNSDDLGIMVTQFLDNNPTIFEAVKKDESIIENFINRYENYLNKKEMNIIEKAKKLLAGKKDVDITLGNGDIVTVVTDSETPQVGDTVLNPEGQPVADDDHVDANGNVITTESGVITAIVEPTDDNDDNGDDNEDESMASEALKAVKDQGQVIEMLLESVQELKSTMLSIQRNINSKKFEAPKKAQKKNIKDEGQDSLATKIAAQREQRKSKND